MKKYFVEYAITLRKYERIYFDTEKEAQDFYNLKMHEFNGIVGLVRMGYEYIN